MSEIPEVLQVEAKARRAYESDPLRVIGAGSWDQLPEHMRAIWRAHVTGNLPPR
jgi:hypothetical protein